MWMYDTSQIETPDEYAGVNNDSHDYLNENNNEDTIIGSYYDANGYPIDEHMAVLDISGYEPTGTFEESENKAQYYSDAKNYQEYYSAETIGDFDSSHCYTGYHQPSDPEAPISPFGHEAYWQQYGGSNDSSFTTDSTMKPLDPNTSYAVSESPVTEPASSKPTDTQSSTIGTPPPGKRKKKKGKTKEERIQQRQKALEEEEDDRLNVATTFPRTTVTKRASSAHQIFKATGFIQKEKRKIQIRVRIARALARRRIPVQLRVLTAQRKYLTPLENYFGQSIEPALDDIFWASVRGDLSRVRLLVEVEHASTNDSNGDPWNMQQTPLHWAAKGGSTPVIEYLIKQGANPRSLDENGSMPLYAECHSKFMLHDLTVRCYSHIACWFGHIDAALELIRATDTTDLYVRDYDAALAPLDWARVRGHTALIKAIAKYEDSKWLPKFVDDLVRGIIRYKIKLFKDPPKVAYGKLNFHKVVSNSNKAQTAEPITTSPTSESVKTIVETTS